MIDLSNIQPGLYQDITHNQYHKELPRDIVSNSYLGRHKHCPASTQIPFEDTETLVFGRGFHAYTLEGQEVFDKEFVVVPKLSWKSKADKLEAIGTLIELCGSDRIDGVTIEHYVNNLKKEEVLEICKPLMPQIITIEEYDTVRYMADAVLRHPTARELLSVGISEQTVIWTDEETGIRCKCRPDNVPDGDRGTMLDIKGMADVSEHAFTRSVVSHGYARQGGMYTEGYMRVTGKIIDIFTFIAVEKKPPFRTEVYTLTTEFLEIGWREFHSLLAVEKKCREEGFYPHYTNAGATDIFPPKYLTCPD